MISVVLVDDHPLVLEGLRAVLSDASDIEVVGEAGNGRDAVAEVARREPDVVLMDLEMPESDGAEATRRIVKRNPGTRVVVLTMFEDDESVLAAMEAGAVGYLVKGSDGTDILTAVRAAATGQAVFGQSLVERLHGWMSDSGVEPRSFPGLTPREYEILDYLAAGLTNPQIAESLGLASKTVANNVSNILMKLQVEQRGQAIIQAREEGLGRLDP